MRLINKLNIYFLFGLLIILTIGTFSQYLYVSNRVENRVQKILKKEKRLLIKQINDKEKSEGFKLYKTEESEVSLSHQKTLKKDTFTKQYFFDEEDNEEVKFMVLSCRVFANDNFYDIVIKKPLLQANDLIYSIIFSFLIILSILFTLYIVLNRFVNKTILNPFYTTLSKLRQYDIEAGQNIQFEQNTGIHEFSFLNEELNEMTTKINKYLENHKQFSENASHELQTPLSIIRAKADILLQSPNLKKEDLNTINSILDAVNRVSKINNSLVILSKIENYDFSHDSELELNGIISELIDLYKPLASIKNISINIDFKEKFYVSINEDWANILLNNLIKNAINHNTENGWLKISATKNQLIIENTGTENLHQPQQYFKRFTKGESTGTTGLGLSIVKDICNKTNLNIEYTCNNSIHKIKLYYQA